MKPVPTLALLVAALAVSCTNAVELPPAPNDVVAVDGVADGTVPDKEVEPSGPVMVSLTPGLELTRSELLGEAVTFIADLGSGRRVLGTSTQLWLYEANTLRAELEVGEAVVAASYVDGVWLFGTTTHVLAWDGESLSPSPLGDAVGGRTPRALHAADGTLWLVMDDSIWHWQSGEVVELTVEGVSTAAATTTWGATFDNAAALWVAADPHIYGLRRTSGGNWDAVVERDDLEVLEMASDASGALWVLGAAGDLHRRQPDGSWEALDVGSAVQAVRAHPESSAAWFVTIAGSVIRHQEGVWLSAPWTELSKPVASSDGGVYVTTGATTEQLIPLGFARHP